MPRHDPPWMSAILLSFLLSVLIVGMMGCVGCASLTWDRIRDIISGGGTGGNNGGTSQPVDEDSDVANNATNPPPVATTFSNPRPHDPNHISEKYNWKVYTAAHPRAFSVKWSSLFYNEIGCSADNTTCLVDGVPLTYYQMDTGEDGLSRRLCYTETAVRNASELPNPVLVELLKDGVRVGAILLANPTNGVTGDTPGTSVSRWEPLPETVVLP